MPQAGNTAGHRATKEPSIVVTDTAHVCKYPCHTCPLGPGWPSPVRAAWRPGPKGRARAPRSCTLVAVWGAQMAAPWILLTDQQPAAVSLEAYGLRVWIEQGFRILKREGWNWHRTRRSRSDRGARWALVDWHWLVMAVATLQVRAYAGTLWVRAEDAARLGRHQCLSPGTDTVASPLLPGMDLAGALAAP